LQPLSQEFFSRPLSGGYSKPLALPSC
jgi:hypothetical protein